MIKEHVSYSEVRQWKECPWRHKLIYIDKLQSFEESPHLHYGTIVHDACEHYLKTKELNLEEVKNKIKSSWEEHGFDSDDFILLQTNRALLQGWKYKHNKVGDWIEWAQTCLLALPDFLEENFPNWEVVAAEEKLYESIESFTNTKFKGYIDCIIRIPQKNGKYKYWILDWKTASARGWSTDKKRDFLTQAQVVLYKNYWAKKNNINLTDVLCGFVLLKKVKKKDKACQIIRVASGPKTLEKSNKLVRSMIKGMNSNLVLKNKQSCKFCDFANTEFCK
jgi:hypothetical protein